MIFNGENYKLTDREIIIYGDIVSSQLKFKFVNENIINISNCDCKNEDNSILSKPPVYLKYNIIEIPEGIEFLNADSNDLYSEQVDVSRKRNRYEYGKQDRLVVSFNDIILEIYLSPFRFIITRSNSDVILKSADDFFELNGEEKKIRFNLNQNERIYGLGQDPVTKLNHINQERRMWQQWGGHRYCGNAGVPFMASSEGYGIFLNSSWPSRFAIGNADIIHPRPPKGDRGAPSPWGWDETTGELDKNTTAIVLDGGILDLYMMFDEKIEGIVKKYYTLTGSPVMLPKWAFGFIQSKNRYRSREEVLYLAETFREKKIPCDVLVIDWLWFKQFGDLEWDLQYWKSMDAMFKQLEEMGFKVLQAQHPFIDRSSSKYDYFKKMGFLNKVPENGRPTFDHTNPEARKEWWKQIKRFYEQGVKAYWTDMGEISEHLPGTESYLGSREKTHNIYTLLWTKGLYEGQRKDYEKRVFSLARSTYSGVQRYSALWSGDIDSSWEVLKDQIIVGQDVALSGQPFWCTDIGGFFSGEDSLLGMNVDTYAGTGFSTELYIRWFEWGTFCPLFRTHGTRSFNEPWSFGKSVENILVKYIDLRYKLMPYIYTCAANASLKGELFMRPMCVDFSGDKVAVEQIYQYMFGPGLLIAPVYDEGKRVRQLYLPSGIWYDYWTKQKIEGGRFIETTVELDKNTNLCARWKYYSIL